MNFAPDAGWISMMTLGRGVLHAGYIRYSSWAALEVLFAIIRKQRINEGFFVTLYPVCPDCSPDAAALAERRWASLAW